MPVLIQTCTWSLLTRNHAVHTLVRVSFEARRLHHHPDGRLPDADIHAIAVAGVSNVLLQESLHLEWRAGDASLDPDLVHTLVRVSFEARRLHHHPDGRLPDAEPDPPLPALLPMSSSLSIFMR
jgi:hypothetical protein